MLGLRGGVRGLAHAQVGAIVAKLVLVIGREAELIRLLHGSPDHAHAPERLEFLTEFGKLGGGLLLAGPIGVRLLRGADHLLRCGELRL
eukprot:6498108-Pyramimonas_sp.AAC.1